MPTLIVMRGSDRLGPYRPEDLAALVDEGVLLPEDACAPADRPSRVRPVSWWLASKREEEDQGVAPPAASAPGRTPGGDRAGEDGPRPSGDDPLFDGRVPLGGDTPVSRGDPPCDSRSRGTRERLLYRGRPCILAYGKGLLLLAALAVGTALFADRLDPPWAAVILTLLALALCILAVHRYTSLYLVTSRRVELVEGLIAKSSREVRIPDIRAINVSRKGLLGLLGVGTVEFASAGSDEVEVAFSKVWRASRVKHLVRDLQESS